MQVLMCKDREVYDIDTGEVLCQALLPGLMQVEASIQNYNSWCQGRYSTRSNVFARVQRSKHYPYKKPTEIDRISGAFSLSDCYWVRTLAEQNFYKLTPYYKKNWINGEPVANIYTNGWQSKRWCNPTLLYKNASKIEMEIMKLANATGLTSVALQDEADGILIQNFTNIDIMFEPADMSVAFYEDVLEDTPLPRTERVVEVMGTYGELMLVFDDIVGNHDRHLGNFGFLRDANTGEFMKPVSGNAHTAWAPFAPLFDFDQSEVRVINSPLHILKYCVHTDEIVRMCRIIIDTTTNGAYRDNSRAYVTAIQGDGPGSRLSF